MVTPVFLTGTARGGTSLIARMLDAHENAAVALDACLPLYRSLRNSMVRRRFPEFDTTQPFGDGYGSAIRRAELQAVLEADCDIAIEPSALPALKSALARRAADESPDLAPAMEALRGERFIDIFKELLALTLRIRGVRQPLCAGLKDPWVVDMFPAIARSMSNARFIVILRDPRDVVSSMLGFLDRDPLSVGHILSVLRHWRKMTACIREFSADPLLARRILVVRYEDVVFEPAVWARKLCNFLGLTEDPNMSAAASFRDYGTGGQWQGNSTFDERLTAISRSPVSRWTRQLPAPVVKLAELCCGPEMGEWGYAPSHAEYSLFDSDILTFLIEDGRRECSWRGDSGDAVLEYGSEISRRSMLRHPTSLFSTEQIETRYLFTGYLKHLQARLTEAQGVPA